MLALACRKDRLPGLERERWIDTVKAEFGVTGDAPPTRVEILPPPLKNFTHCVPEQNRHRTRDLDQPVNHRQNLTRSSTFRGLDFCRELSRYRPL